MLHGLCFSCEAGRLSLPRPFCSQAVDAAQGVIHALLPPDGMWAVLPDAPEAHKAPCLQDPVMRQAARVHAAPKGPSPVAPPARRPQGRRQLAARATGFDSPQEGTARSPPPLTAVPLPSPPPCGSDGGDTPTAQVSMQPGRQPQGSGCACSTQYTFKSVTPLLSTWSTIWGVW